MGANKITKKVAETLKYIESKLPVFYREVPTPHYILGEDARLSGLEPPIMEEGFQKDAWYRFYVSLLHKVDHERRLRRAFKNAGDAGVKQYIQKVVNNDWEALSSPKEVTYCERVC